MRSSSWWQSLIFQSDDVGRDRSKNSSGGIDRVLIVLRDGVYYSVVERVCLRCLVGDLAALEIKVVGN